MKLYSRRKIKEIENRHGFRKRKKLGQNFLTDKAVIDEIVKAVQPGRENLIIEIGPGMGVLTVEMASKAGKVTAVEIDEDLIPILSDVLRDFDNVTVVNQDILKIDLREMIENAMEENRDVEAIKIVGNLPYYITTPIIMKLLEENLPVTSITVMMQKEVADRLMAIPGTKAYGAITLAVEYYCWVRRICDVGREAFVPAPNVDSTVLRLDLREKKAVELLDEEFFFDCIRRSFGKRRKTLLNSLTGWRGIEKKILKEILFLTGIDPARRGETLTIEEFASLANNIKKRIGTDE